MTKVLDFFLQTSRSVSGSCSSWVLVQVLSASLPSAWQGQGGEEGLLCLLG